MKILVVEDNEILSKNICTYLKIEGIITVPLLSGEKVLYTLAGEDFDMIIMDIGLPDISGIDLCDKIRESGRSIPILLLTARNTMNDKIAGFKSGADDYLTKPFEYEELLLRIHALVRRNYSQKGQKIFIHNGTISIDTQTKEVELGGNLIHMSQLEYDLLLYLSQNKAKTISKDVLLEKVWGEYDAFHMTRTVDVYIGYVRKKLGKDIIITKRGEGYLIP